ncbi:DUF4870 domain-containing protein [Thalassomonas sp. M1454]|uniref:DUF4870 domain-containing protein n=1 Tax=Thalassomonas sp. M1454 TaxID=2594477 RepID=UPI00117CAB31|nr:hypothetical protein [Thalassomonas sp. M1454]TRX56778.1 hypothetical protein FNN08_04410 [Thalassomonas sp. M1454]
MTQDELFSKFNKVDSKTIAVISYLSIIGWIIALLLHGKNPSKLAVFHLRQSLGFILTWVLLTFIPLIGWILALPVLALWCIGIYNAFEEKMLPVPFLGDFYQHSFNSLIE